MGLINLRRPFLEKQNKLHVTSIRFDPEENRRIFHLVLLTKKKKSDLIREAIYELIKNRYPEVLI